MHRCTSRRASYSCVSLVIVTRLHNSICRSLSVMHRDILTEKKKYGMISPGQKTTAHFSLLVLVCKKNHSTQIDVIYNPTNNNTKYGTEIDNFHRTFWMNTYKCWTLFYVLSQHYNAIALCNDLTLCGWQGIARTNNYQVHCHTCPSQLRRFNTWQYMFVNCKTTETKSMQLFMLSCSNTWIDINFNRCSELINLLWLERVRMVFDLITWSAAHLSPI